MRPLASLLFILAACSDRAASPPPPPPEDPAPPSLPVAAVVDAAPPDATIDAPTWLPGERPLPRSAGNDDPPVCMEVATCAAACDAGDGASCYWLGYRYVIPSEVAKEVPHDPQKGLELYLQACDYGITLGCHGAAQLFRLGSPGIAVDKARAARLFQKACDLGMDAACRNAKDLRPTPRGK